MSEAAANIATDNCAIGANGFARGSGTSNASTGTTSNLSRATNFGRASASAFSASR